MASLGSASQGRVTMDVGRPLRLGDEGTWLHGGAFRVNMLWQDGGVPGRDLVDAGAPRHRAVSRPGPRQPHARDPGRAADEPGQRARLRRAGRCLGRAADADLDAGAGPGRPDQLLRHRRLRPRRSGSAELHGAPRSRLRPGLGCTTRRATTGPRAKRWSPPSRMSRPTIRKRTWSRSRARATSARTRSSRRRRTSRIASRRVGCNTRQPPASSTSTKSSSRRPLPASGRARRSTSSTPTRTVPS